jgi:hypothetical protein
LWLLQTIMLAILKIVKVCIQSEASPMLNRITECTRV